MWRLDSIRRTRGRANSSSTSGDSDEQTQQPPPVPPLPSSRAASLHSFSEHRGTVSDGEYARKCRALMVLLRDLRNLGADSVFDLPMIGVIGSQSAGKSSLIEAVTGINVPRDSGTCTRCPMECTMSSVATPWTCTISLRTGVSGQFGGNSRRFGPEITEKREVELWLRRAQAAILSTERDDDKWLTKSAEEIRQAIDSGTGMRMFTEDTIVVDIKDQGLTDLSFVDLPGLIQNADMESIGLIRDLSRHHIQGENTLILVTIPVIDDIQNQGAVLLAKRSDPNGLRTIGVLTKPDLLGAGDIGAHRSWKQTMENVPGSQHYLRHGYYCVRLPDDEMRRQGYTAHNLPNRDYFEVTRPWSEVEDRGRFGVDNLVRDISTLLARLVERNLPRLREAVDASLRVCLSRLAKVPPLFKGDAMTNIMRMVNEFVREIGAAGIGNAHKILAQGCRARYLELRDDILATCPQFRRKTASDGNDVYDIETVQRLIKDCTGWELPGFIPYETYETLIREFVSGWQEPAEACFEDIYVQISTFIVALSETHFGSFRNLKNFVLTHARGELVKSKAETDLALHKLLKIEEKPFFTQRATFVEEQDRWTRHYHGVFCGASKELYRYRDELHVMGTVHTYFQLAYERFSDTMLLMIEHDLVQSLKANLETTLINGIMQVRNIGDAENLLAEDPNHERDRRELTSRRERLEGIRDRLVAFSMS